MLIIYSQIKFLQKISYSLNDASIYKPQKSKKRDEKSISKHHFFNILHISLTFFSKLNREKILQYCYFF